MYVYRGSRDAGRTRIIIVIIIIIIIKIIIIIIIIILISLIADGPHLIITIQLVVTKDLPISPRFTPYNFLSRCKFSTLTTRESMVEFYLLTFPRFPLRKKEHKSYFSKNLSHDFRTSRCAGYLLDHSGDDTCDKSF